MEVVEEEPELCFEEDEGGWSERSEGLVWIESAYEIGQYCFYVLLHLGLVEFKLDWEKQEPEGNQFLYWAGLYLSYNWEYVLDHFCCFNGHFFVTWSGLPQVWQLIIPRKF